MDQEEEQLKKQFEERFKTLPKVVQDAITSADLDKRLRELAQTQKLHLDQWDLLENEVKLALYGFEPVESLAKNIQSEVGVSPEAAKALSEGISKIVFEPVRQELERQLEHPDAKAQTESGVEAARTEILSADKQRQVVVPATPPASLPQGKAERAQIAPADPQKTPSHERKDIVGDPYREQTK